MLGWLDFLIQFTERHSNKSPMLHVMFIISLASFAINIYQLFITGSDVSFRSHLWKAFCSSARNVVYIIEATRLSESNYRARLATTAQLIVLNSPIVDYISRSDPNSSLAR